MKVIEKIGDMQSLIKDEKLKGNVVGFVPTMGYLHEGHQQLMRKAREECDIVVTSIFVNPLQFGPNEDFDRYPRDERRDKRIADEEQNDVLFFPHVREMYPTNQSVKMTVHRRVNVMCGKSREGHFDGVVTVLAKLFNIVMPDRVYMGMKDAQQVAVVDALIEDYNFPIKLIPVETVREVDQLAKSSRNVYLSPTERKEAPYLYQALLHGKSLIEEGESSPQAVIEAVSYFIKTNTHGKIDYVDVLSYPQLEPLDECGGEMILALAVNFEKARLIDNVLVSIH
ncbi:MULTISPECIES: pantoate--beta-alanine ligase [Pontibacillus]|uniref:Pantothenate synthetase n=1 Tax=Pontibacillus chungwhensis TaxID=265426 RepID=A0ABY8URR1_9BACI|nr:MULTISPECIES: pantoate--beta-alanine ligase [Pontibacillus]MCD5322966.1 pantoate--beta-alanine ligase [Pontibacillus sp. HN14]WIF96360.1 pantoate--beta-alanine ligase [Pontibacillus chungwhensis]